VSLVAILLALRISQEQGVKKKARTTVDLKQNIREEVAAIFSNMLQRVTHYFQKRFGECVDNKGRHLTGTIFRK
jgi:carbon monoxide dehydrogenase subunit G